MLRVKAQINKYSTLIQNTEDTQLKSAYVKRIRMLSQKVQYTLLESKKHLFCRRCSQPFSYNYQKGKFGIQMRLRAKRNPHIVYTCLNCGYIRRKFY